MDFVKKFAGEQQQSGQQGSVQQVPAQQGESGGFLSGIGNKLNAAAGGGPESEKNEDYLDKGKLGILTFDVTIPDTNTASGVDFVQEKFMGQGPQVYTLCSVGSCTKRLTLRQNNESAIEQAKDEQISDFIRNQWKSTTGSDFPIKDKETKF